MLNVFDYIRNYCKAHDIADFSTKSKIITLPDFAKIQTFAPGIAFFHKLNIIGEISNTDNITSNLLTADTNIDFYDFSKIVSVKDFGTFQNAETNFVFECDNMLKLELFQGSDAMFYRIISAQLHYIYVIPQYRLQSDIVKEDADFIIELQKK